MRRTLGRFVSTAWGALSVACASGGTPESSTGLTVGQSAGNTGTATGSTTAVTVAPTTGSTAAVGSSGDGTTTANSTGTTAATTGAVTTGADSSGSTTGGPAVCTIAVLYDFSTCPGEFTTGQVVGLYNSWACGDPDAGPPGTGMWGTNLSGPYGTNESSYVQMPSFSMDDCAGKTVRLRLRHWYVTEAGRDGGNVQVSVDGGTMWEVLEATGHPYDTTSLMSAYIPPRTQPAFSGPDGMWRESWFDLSGYAGYTNVSIRFVFGANNVLQDYLGWYLDEAEIVVE